MKKLLSTVFFIAFCLCSIAQKAPVKFGEISMEDMKMGSYNRDSSAAAVILADYGESIIDFNKSDGWFKLYFERITRIKILNSNGYKHADFEIPLYHDATATEKLSNLKVVTYNLEGGKIVETKMKSDLVFEEKYDQNIDLQKFTAPNVKVGSIIEVSYRVTSDFMYYFRDWEFQSKIPVVWSEYRAVIPEYYNYEKFAQGYVMFDVNEVKDVPKIITITSKDRWEGPATLTTFDTDNINYMAKSHRWVAKDVPAFKDEPYMTTDNDYISKINFELAYYRFPSQPVKQIIGTWSDLNYSLLVDESFGAIVRRICVS